MELDSHIEKAGIEHGVKHGDYLVDGIRGPVGSLKVPQIYQILQELFPSPAQDATFENRSHVDFRALPVGSYTIVWGKCHPSAAYMVWKCADGQIAVTNLHQDPKAIGYFIANDSDLGTSFYRKDEITDQPNLTYFPGQLVVGEPIEFPYFETKRKRFHLFETRRVLTPGRSKSWRDTCGKIQVFEKKSIMVLQNLK